MSITPEVKARLEAAGHQAALSYLDVTAQPKCVKAANPKPFDRIHKIHRMEFVEKSCKSCPKSYQGEQLPKM